LAKIPKFQITYNQYVTLSVRHLKQWGYLDKSAKGSFSWGKNEVLVSSFVSDTEHYIEFGYLNDSIIHRIYLVKKVSNLGNGYYYFFKCPLTKKLCRKLYLSNGTFLHREASKGMYECQKLSKNSRNLIAFFKFGMRESIELQPYFKSTYRGKPTRRYLNEQKKDDVYLKKHYHIMSTNKELNILMGL
jgi:hypothetical protein